MLKFIKRLFKKKKTVKKKIDEVKRIMYVNKFAGEPCPECSTDREKEGYEYNLIHGRKGHKKKLWREIIRNNEYICRQCGFTVKLKK